MGIMVYSLLWYNVGYMLIISLRTLNYGNYGIVLMMGNAGFILSSVGPLCGVNVRACRAPLENG